MEKGGVNRERSHRIAGTSEKIPGKKTVGSPWGVHGGTVKKKRTRGGRRDTKQENRLSKFRNNPESLHVDLVPILDILLSQRGNFSRKRLTSKDGRNKGSRLKRFEGEASGGTRT